MSWIMNIPVWPFILISALTAGFFAIYVPRHNRKSEASNKFRTTVLNELKSLYPEGIYQIDGRDVVKLLREKHTVINAAVLEYRSFLLWKRPLDKAWKKFSGIGLYRDVDELARYNHYSFTGNKLSHFSEDPKGLFLKNVMELLSHAKKT